MGSRSQTLLCHGLDGNRKYVSGQVSRTVEYLSLRLRCTVCFVNHETHTRNREPGYPGTDASVRVRLVTFELAMLAIGRERLSQQARLLEIDVKTLKRALAGENVGERFMAQTISAFRGHANTLARRGISVSLDEFFEVPTTEEMASA